MSILRFVGSRWLIAIVLASLGGCDGGEMKDITVSGHVFRVPRAHLVKEGIPWLPTNQSEHLLFVINPEARPQEQMVVGVDPSQGTCQPSASPTSNMLEWA